MTVEIGENKGKEKGRRVAAGKGRKWGGVAFRLHLGPLSNFCII